MLNWVNKELRKIREELRKGKSVIRIHCRIVLNENAKEILKRYAMLLVVK